MPTTTLPVPIGGKVTLPGGTIIEVLGTNNGHVGLSVTEAVSDAARPKPKRRANGNGRGRHFTPLAECQSEAEYWALFSPGRGWAAWHRKYKNLSAWIAANPGGVAGRQIDHREARSRGFDCSAQPMTEGLRAAYDQWEERRRRRLQLQRSTED